MARTLRAISPVVAVLLLILVAVGAAVLIYLWLTGFAGQATQTPSSLQTQFKIETARIYNGTYSNLKGNATIEIYIRNTGRTSIDLKVAAEQNALAIYIYDSYSGDLVYANTTLFLLDKDNIPDPIFNPTSDVIAIYDGNKNGVWEPGELLVIKFADPTLRSDGVTRDGKLWLRNGGSPVGLPCGHYYDIKVIISGQSDTIQNVRVACK